MMSSELKDETRYSSAPIEQMLLLAVAISCPDKAITFFDWVFQ